MLSSEGSGYEVITPYKITLLALIKNYAVMESDVKHHDHPRIVWLDDEVICKRKLNLSLLNWIQQPDGTLKSILQILGSCSRTLHSSLCNTLQSLCETDSPQVLDDFFEDVGFLISSPQETNLLQRSGITGLFCRSMFLHHEKLPFCELKPLLDKLTRYCSVLLESRKPPSHLKKSFHHGAGDDVINDVINEYDDKSDSFDEMELESQSELDSKSSEESALGIELKPSDLKTDERSEDLEVTEVFTSKQADYFFAQQAALITDKETMAMSPPKLQAKISQILKNNPKLTEAHYLSYLNCLRVREFCGSIDCLLTYFNRHAKAKGNTQGSSTTDQASGICRYAALNLALLHHRFGHRNAAIAAVREAVDLSQLAADMQCLQHAMSLMSELDPGNVHLSLMEHQVKPAKQMNLINLAAKAIQRDNNKQALLGKRPCHVFMQLTASEALASSRAIESLSPTSYIHKGALWRMYGKRHMASLYCMLALSTNLKGRKGTNLFPWQPNIAEVALSLCHLVELLHEAGDTCASQEILRHTKQRFPWNTEHSKLWQVTELRLKHKMALRSCKFSEASQIEQEILALDKQEADYRKAERFYLSGDEVKSYSVLQDMLKTASAETMSGINNMNTMKQCTPELRCRIYILLCRNLFDESSDSSTSLTYLLKALSTATKYYLHGLIIEAKLLIAQLQLHSMMPQNAAITLSTLNHECLANGSLLDLSRLKLIQAMVKMADEKNQSLNSLNSIIELILDAKQGFEISQDLLRQKYVAYLLAGLFHKKSQLLSDNSASDESIKEAISNRNAFSSEFRQLDSLTYGTCSSLPI
ncbi:anaphase-promoting complex subunit 5-like [Styela clava]